MPLKMTKGQQDFVDQMTRKMTVEWCKTAIETDDDLICIPEFQAVYRDHAVTKKWLSAKSGLLGPNRILGAGWSTAARFLKR